MNLLFNQWVPIKRKNGERQLISPVEITSDFETNPVMEFDLPRADFNGALIQFFIGLCQQLALDLKKNEYKNWFDYPPTSEQLNLLLKPLSNAFELWSDNAAFMQDFELREGEPKEVSSLLIEQPGEQTIKENADHFVKRGQIKSLCQACATMALFTLQINAPSGGAGHRTSLRGGGPLTTLIISQTEFAQPLWKKVWLNVLPPDIFKSHFNKWMQNKNLTSDVFPWLVPTRTSEDKTGKNTYAEDVHPLQMYWCMPRRIRFNSADLKLGDCDICLSQNILVINQYITKNYGINYSGNWEHPLTPYQKKDKEVFPLHPQPGGLGYKDWLGMRTEHNQIKSSLVIYNFKKTYDIEADELKIWAFGYDMDNMKARGWHEHYLPFFEIPEDQRNNFIFEVNNFLEAASQANYYLRGALKKIVGDKENLKMVQDNFWSSTQVNFFHHIKKLIKILEAKDDIRMLEIKAIKRSWLESCLIPKTLEIFEYHSASQWTDPLNLKQICEAENNLRKKIRGSKIYQILGLIEEEKIKC